MQYKHFNIPKNFYQIFGISHSILKKCFLFSGLNNKIFLKKFKTNQLQKIFKVLKKKPLGKNLKKYIYNRLKFYFEIRSWKGIRHYNKYPIRGQRTRTNAKTKKNISLVKNF